ncbi:MAG: 30S ribosomal protein S8 [Candidatus Aenigmatarchaeota archaeon]
MRHDLLSDVLFVMNNAEDNGKTDCTVPASKLIKNVLDVIQKHGYIKGYELLGEGKHMKCIVKMSGNINKVRAIRPRLSVKKDGYERIEKRYLPAKDFGILVISTSKGTMSQKEAITMGLGGKIIAYVY